MEVESHAMAASMKTTHTTVVHVVRGVNKALSVNRTSPCK
jgi:hypothetical protein